MRRPGIFKARVESVGLYQTPNGYAQLCVVFALLAEMNKANLEAAPIPCPPGPEKLTVNPTTDRSFAWMMDCLRAMGYDRPDLEGVNPDGPAPFNFKGREFLVQCKLEEFNGATRDRWSVYFPPTKLGSDKLEALNKRFARKYQAMREEENKEVGAAGEATSA